MTATRSRLPKGAAAVQNALSGEARMGRRAVMLGLVATASLGTAGCVARYQNPGYVPTDEDLAEITVGADRSG